LGGGEQLLGAKAKHKKPCNIAAERVPWTNNVRPRVKRIRKGSNGVTMVGKKRGIAKLRGRGKGYSTHEN